VPAYLDLVDGNELELLFRNFLAILTLLDDAAALEGDLEEMGELVEPMSGSEGERRGMSQLIGPVRGGDNLL
jgi:hypothetical protein